ncbi:MAG TPA: SpoIIE family protein phosphatase [Candidatus Ozemobacteraceae bacterium]|nr:SpoIIE family protein phosphatase [Candidatus Ozemobacteraceae bacterium]
MIDYRLKGMLENPFVKGLLNSLGEGLVIADAEGRVLYLNTQAERILAVTFEEIRGKEMALCHRCPWRITEILGNSASDAPYRAEIPVRDRWLTITASPLLDGEGGLAGSVMVARDTTERHQLEAALKKTNAELKERHEGLDLQIELARNIQKSLMPADLAAFPRARVRLWNKQSQVVGGDVLFVQEEKDGGWLLIGDIMGKGLFASQFVPLIHEHMHEEIDRASSPADLLTRLNDRLTSFIGERFTLFITMVCLRWNATDGTLRGACAGHEPPFVIGPDGAISTFGTQGPPLGLGIQNPWAGIEVALAPGSRVVCFTDGVKEVFKDDPAADREGWLRTTVDEIVSRGGDPFSELVGHLNRLALKKAPHDDQSLMVLEVQ